MNTRRYEIDWLRILVFALLIVYHVSMYFNPWWWHVKSTQTYEWMRLPLLAINQWRLEILFMISGMGTYFSLRKRKARQFSKERFLRLGLPLVVGIFLVIPPQVYIERVVNNGMTISYLEFLSTVAFQGLYPVGNISWNHLWFLPYLLCYSLMLLPLMPFFKGDKFPLISKRLIKQIHRKPWKIYLFILPLIFVEATLSPFFPVVPKLIGDWYAFSHYFLLFVFGFGWMHYCDDFFDFCLALRNKALLIAALSFGAQIYCFPYMSAYLIVELLQSTLEIVYLWSVIIVVFGYGVKYLSYSSKYLSYLNEAVYPFYIFHQTVLLFGLYQFKVYFQSDLNFFFFLIAVTLLGSWMLFEFVRRINLLRPLFGIKGKYRSKDNNKLPAKDSNRNYPFHTKH